LKQKVTLCGPGITYFHDSCQALRRIHRFINKSFPVGEVRPLGPITFEGMDTIMVETRVVTPMESMMWTPRPDALGSSIDPDNLLHSLVRNGKYQFTEDNIVEYLEIVPDDVEG
jgi:hypothetical protein